MRKVIGDYLIQFRDKTVTHKNNEQNTKAMVMVDDRRSFWADLLLKNFATYLDDTWNFYFVCGDYNYQWMVDTTNKLGIQVSIMHIGDILGYNPGRINVKSFNDLFLSEKFWLGFRETKILTAEFDSCLFSAFNDRFMEYDMIGAPCGDTGDVFNGGLCLRTRDKMLEVIRGFGKMYDGGNEDVFFSKYIREVGAKLPDTQTAIQFSVESSASQVPFGFHGTDKYYIQDEILRQFYTVSTPEIHPKKPLLFVCTPVYKWPPHPKFTESLQRIKDDPRFDVEFRAVIGDAHIERARAMTLMHYLQKDRPYDWYVAIDSDIEFNADILWGIINNGKPVIGAAYAFKADKDTPKFQQPVVRGISGKEPQPDGTVQVAYLGGGFTVVRDDVIQKLCQHYPELKFCMNPDLTDGKKNATTYALWNPILVDQPEWGKDENGNVWKEMLSEDYSFCQRILDMGQDIWLDLKAYIAHWSGDKCYQLALNTGKSNADSNVTNS